MKVLKVRLYQNLVNYRRELSFGYVQTYPLPTPSMVKGMAHNLLGLKEYKNLQIGIQGRYKTIITNMQKVVKFDRVRDDSKKGIVDPRFRIRAGGSQRTLNSGIMYVDLIVDMNLVLHIKFDEDELNKRLFEKFQTDLVILGRNQDIARVEIDKLKMIDIEKQRDDKILHDYNIYLNESLSKSGNVFGTNFRLPFYYKDISILTDKRIFKYVDVCYITKGNKIEDTEILVDEDNDFVDFLKVDNDE